MLWTQQVCLRFHGPSTFNWTYSSIEHSTYSLALKSAWFRSEISGGSRISRWGGADPLGGHQSPMCTLFGENICKNERNWSCWGGGAPAGGDPPGSANADGLLYPYISRSGPVPCLNQSKEYGHHTRPQVLQANAPPSGKFLIHYCSYNAAFAP